MKKFTKLITATGAVLAFSIHSQERLCAKADAASNITTPLTIVKNEDMDFGNIALSASVSRMIILTPTGTRITRGHGTASLSPSPDVESADFTLSGAAGYSYSITLPASVPVHCMGNTLMLIAFTSLPATTGVLNSGGNQELKVGATLLLPAGQAPGSYTNSSGVMVTVNYN